MDSHTTRVAILALACAAPVAAQEEAPTTPRLLIAQLENAWRDRDASSYASLWSGPLVSQEARFAAERFSADESPLKLDGPLRETLDSFELAVELFIVREPRARIEQWRLRAQRGERGWRFVTRDSAGQIDGLLHLSLEPQGYVADGMTLQLDDFELQMERGTLFASPTNLDSAILVFEGRGRLSFRPHLEAEREQLSLFCGKPTLVEKVKRAFINVHPSDLGEILPAWPPPHDDESARRLREASTFFADQAARTYLLDADVPRSPWWLSPSPGETIVIVDGGKRGELTYAVSRSQPEGISLRERRGGRQINLYPVAGSDTDYREDAGRTTELLHSDLHVRYEPGDSALSVEATLRVRLLQPQQTLRLNLDDAFAVQSVRSEEAGEHRVFRMRGRNRVMVSLGGLASTIGEAHFTIRYAGRLAPYTIHDEVLQSFDRSQDALDIPIEPAFVFSNRQSWYPSLSRTDFATTRLVVDIPREFRAASGGRSSVEEVHGNRRVVEFVQEQRVRYLAFVVARLESVAESEEIRSEGTALQEQGDRETRLHGLATARTKDRFGADLALSRQILRFYTREFGPLPWDELRLVGLEGEVPGGHSPPGMIVMSYRPLLLRRLLRDDPAQVNGVVGFFLAHELAHQWWGHGVAPQNYRERWISEAFAHYAATMWVREAQGEEALQRILSQFERWVRRTRNEGPIHLGQRLGHIENDPKVFRAVVYDKGAYVLHMLRAIVGPNEFREALTGLQHEFRFRTIGTRHVREALERASGLDLREYFEAWVKRSELPVLRYRVQRSRPRDGYAVELEILPEALPGPVPLEIRIELDNGAQQRERITLPPSGGRWRFLVPDKPRDIEVNSDRGLLTREVKEM